MNGTEVKRHAKGEREWGPGVGNEKEVSEKQNKEGTTLYARKQQSNSEHERFEAARSTQCQR